MGAYWLWFRRGYDEGGLRFGLRGVNDSGGHHFSELAEFAIQGGERAHQTVYALPAICMSSHTGNFGPSGA